MRLKGKLIVDQAILARHLTDNSKQAVWEYKNHLFPILARDLAAGSGSSVEATDNVFSGALTKRTGGSPSLTGVVTDSPYNKCVMRNALTNTRIEDSSAREVFARLTKIDTALTGALGFIHSQATVNGTGTLFLSELSIGDYIKLDSSGIVGKVQSITSNVLLELETGYEGESGSGASSKVNLYLLFFVELANNTEQSHFMVGEQIDFFFPESFDMFAAPFDAFIAADSGSRVTFWEMIGTVLRNKASAKSVAVKLDTNEKFQILDAGSNEQISLIADGSWINGLNLKSNLIQPLTETAHITNRIRHQDYGLLLKNVSLNEILYVDEYGTVKQAGLYDGGIVSEPIFPLRTNNAVPIDLLSIPIPEGASYRINAEVVARQSDGSNIGTFKIFRAFNRNAGQDVTAQVNYHVFFERDDIAWDLDLIPDTMNQTANLRAIGKAATEIDWKGFVRYFRQ